MKRMFLMAVLAAVCGIACAQEDTNLYYKVFVLPEGECECLGHGHLVVWPIKETYVFLSKYANVQWPLGSQIIQPVEQDNQIVIRNTKENLSKLDSYFLGISGKRQVSIEYMILAFRRCDIEEVLEKGSISYDSLMKLREKRRHKVIATACALTKSGNEVVPKTVEEVTYPTEISYVAVTNQAGISWALVPSNFEMTEVGIIPQIVPEISPDGKTVRVLADCKRVTIVRWDTFDSVAVTTSDKKKLAIRHPVFEVSEVNTCVEATSGETVLLGGGGAADRDWSEYHFLKATVVWPKSSK